MSPLPKKIGTVRVIGYICIFQAVGSRLLGVLISGLPEYLLNIREMLPLHIIAQGLLFLLAAKMMKYGAMLQQESDETL